MKLILHNVFQKFHMFMVYTLYLYMHYTYETHLLFEYFKEPKLNSINL